MVYVDNFLTNFLNTKAKQNNLGLAVSNKFIYKVKEKFINRYTFLGDEKFTPFIQKQLLNCLFTYGMAGLLKIKDEMVVMNCYPFYNSISLLPFTANGEIINARGIPYFQRFLISTSKILFNEKMLFKLTEKNTAFISPLDYGMRNNSLQNEVEPFAVELGKLWEIANHINKQQHNQVIIPNELSAKPLKIQLENANAIIDLNANVDSNNVDDNASIESLKNELNNNIQIIKYSSDLDKQLSSIEKYQSLIYSLFGIRHTQTFKKSRMLNKEISGDKNEYRLNEFSQLILLENFVKNYKKVFGIELEIVDNIAGDETEEMNENAPEKDGENNESEENING